MSGKGHSLYPVQKKDIRRAAVMVADAFQHDPVWNAILCDTTPEPRAYVFETPVRYGLKFGEVYAPSENLVGVIHSSGAQSPCASVAGSQL
jgi:hypothetical protein